MSVGPGRGEEGGGGPGHPDGSPRPHSAGLQNPIDTMFHLQPLMFLGLFPLFAIFEGMLGRPSWGHLSTTDAPSLL